MRGPGMAASIAGQFLVTYLAALAWFMLGSTWLWGDLVAHTDFGTYLVREMHVRPAAERPAPHADAVWVPWPVSEVLEGEAEFAAICALQHTVLLLAGASVGGWLRDVSAGSAAGVQVALPVAVLAAAFPLLRHHLRRGFDDRDGLVYRWAMRWFRDEGADSFALLASTSMTIWLSAALVLPHLAIGKRGSVGALPSSIARYLVWYLLVAIGSFLFFHIGPRVASITDDGRPWNDSPERSAPWSTWVGGGSGPASSPALLASVSHTMAIACGVSVCAFLNVCVRAVAGGWTVETARRSTLWDLCVLGGSTALFAALVADVWWPAVERTQAASAAASAARAFLPLPAAQRDALASKTAYVASYAMWFAGGVVFEQAWEGSATNSYLRGRSNPRRRRWTGRLFAAALVVAGGVWWDLWQRWAEAGAVAQAVSVLCVAATVVGVLQPARRRGANVGRHTGREYAAGPGTAKRARLDRFRLRSDFPGPYPNGWYRACLSDELPAGSNPLTLSALGTDIVLFRGADGVVGALHAFCPHLGTHLGGAEVRGCRLVCPYHEWAFNAAGKCEDIPYHPTGKLPERANNRAYPVREVLGIVYIWYHADREEPEYVLDEVERVADPKNKFRLVVDQPFGPDWLMHVMEPSQNSADWYHFRTVHRHLPNFIHPNLLAVDHTLRAYFTEGVSGGSGPRDQEGWERKMGTDRMPPTHLYVRETITELKVCGRFALPHFIARFFDTSVFVQSPQNLVFCLDTPLGSFRGVMNMLPVEPFRQRGMMRVFVNGWWPGILARIVAHLICETANQDREVWEHRMHVAPRNLVAGDGPFVAYGNWLKQFYSASSTEMNEAVQLEAATTRMMSQDW